jgi:hypothetical protein
MPRTGTTFMHNILFLDSARFTSMKLWEIAFAPSVLQKRMYLLIKKADARLGFPLKRLLVRIEKRLLKSFDSFHPLSLFQIEEDEYLMIHNFSSALMPFFLPPLKRVSMETLTQKQGQAASSGGSRYYRNCIRKHMHVFGNGREYLAKSPAHLPRMDQLRALFPDLKIICMLRMPHETIPSTISLFGHFNSIFHAGLDAGEIVQKTLDLADISFDIVAKSGSQENNGAFSLVLFEEFTANPEASVTEIYSCFGFTITEEFRASMEGYCHQQSGFVSGHVYSLEKYGLTLEILYSRYKGVYDKYFYGKPY